MTIARKNKIKSKIKLKASDIVKIENAYLKMIMGYILFDVTWEILVGMAKNIVLKKFVIIGKLVK